MIGKKVIEEIPITQSEALDILKELEKEKKKEGSEEVEMLYEQKAALEHLKRFKKLNSKKARKLVEDLIKLNEKIDIKSAVKLADLMPEDEITVKAVFAKERHALSDEEIKKVLEIIDNYRS